MSERSAAKARASSRDTDGALRETAPEGATPQADPVRRLASTAGNRAVSDLLGQGRPLADELRLPMEARFGADFSGVRVHDHPQAHASARAHGAKAYAHGEDIVFGAQRFAPQRPDGRHLLAHELAHVVQQRRGGAAPGDGAHSATEQGATAAADAVSAGSGPVAVAGASGVGVACEKEDDEEKKTGQASTTVLTQKPMKSRTPAPMKSTLPTAPAKPGVREHPIQIIDEPNKAKGTGAEVAVPFDRYAGPEWNHVGGGAETSTSRTSLARRSSHDIAAGRQEGTAGFDFIVENVKTGMLVIGEQKATQGKQFNDASAITSSLESNLEATVKTLKAQVESGQVHPDQVPALERTIARLEGTHKALLDPTGKTQLPEGVVFELTNVRGEGEQIGKGHIDLLAEKYGNRPALLDHLLSRTFVRDPALAEAAASKRKAAGQPAADGDPGAVPANDLLTDQAKSEVARLKAGKTPAEWNTQKAKARSSAGGKAAKPAPSPQEERLAAQFKQQQNEERDRARAARLDELQQKRAAANEPEPRLKKDRNRRDAAERKQARDAGKAAKDAVAAKQEKWQERAAGAEDRARNKAYRNELKQARKTVAGMQGKPPEAWDKVPLADRQRAERLASDPALAPKEAQQAQKHLDRQLKDAQRKANSAQARDFDDYAKRGNQEIEERNRRRTDSEQQAGRNKQEGKGARPRTSDEKMSNAAHRLNQAAGAVRGLDAFLDARDRGKGYGEAALDAGKTYLENTNPYLGALATFEGRMRKEKLPDGREQQYYGNDAGDAFFGTLGENIAGQIVPGKGWDQLINGGANLIAAGDDHLKRNLPPDSPERNKANLRTGTDLAAELTPSRMFASTIGAGMRAWYDLDRASRGDATGVDKFGEDAVRGKLGSIIQPWAMAADFAGNLGGDNAGAALDKTLAKSKDTTLAKVGNSLGDGMYALGESADAKAGKYGGSVQGVSMALGMTSDMIAGKTFEQALDKAADAGKGSTLEVVGSAMGDAAFETVQAAKETYDKGEKVVKEDLPALKKAVEDRAKSEYGQAREKLTRWWNN